MNLNIAILVFKFIKQIWIIKTSLINFFKKFWAILDGPIQVNSKPGFGYISPSLEDQVTGFNRIKKSFQITKQNSLTVFIRYCPSPGRLKEIKFGKTFLKNENENWSWCYKGCRKRENPHTTKADEITKSNINSNLRKEQFFFLLQYCEIFRSRLNKHCIPKSLMETRC